MSEVQGKESEAAQQSVPAAGETRDDVDAAKQGTFATPVNAVNVQSLSYSSSNPTANISNPAPPPHTVVYVVDRQDLPYYYTEFGNNVRDNAERDSPMCAMVGFIFSWIPIVGLITFLVNCDAPRGSQRRFWASAALLVSSLVILFNLIFWSSYRNN